MNVITSALSAVMFVFTTFLVARLRRSARVRQKMQRFLPHSWFEHKDSKKQTRWYKKSKKEKPDVGLHQPWQHSGSRYPPSCVPAIQHEQDTPGMPGGHYPIARARTEWPNTVNEVNTVERQMAIPVRSQTVDSSINMSREEHLARLDRQIAELDAARRRVAGSETE